MNTREKMAGPTIIRTYVCKERYPKEYGPLQSTWDMSARPEYYSGRGAIVGDLSSAQLEMVYRGVKKEYGEDAAARFVQMVYDIDKLSAK